jgi:hypothetical protein
MNREFKNATNSNLNTLTAVSAIPLSLRVSRYGVEDEDHFKSFQDRLRLPIISYPEDKE